MSSFREACFAQGRFLRASSGSIPADRDLHALAQALNAVKPAWQPGQTQAPAILRWFGKVPRAPVWASKASQASPDTSGKSSAPKLSSLFPFVRDRPSPPFVQRWRSGALRDACSMQAGSRPRCRRLTPTAAQGRTSESGKWRSRAASAGYATREQRTENRDCLIPGLRYRSPGRRVSSIHRQLLG